MAIKPSAERKVMFRYCDRIEDYFWQAVFGLIAFPFTIIPAHKFRQLQKRVDHEGRRVSGEWVLDAANTGVGCLVADIKGMMLFSTVWWTSLTIENALEQLQEVPPEDVRELMLTDPRVMDSICSVDELEVGDPTVPIPILVLHDGVPFRILYPKDGKLNSRYL